MKASWKTETLEELSERVTVGIATSVSEHYRPSGVPIFRNQNILPGKLDDSDLLFISEEFAKRNAAKALKTLDVLTVRTGNVGISAIVPAKYQAAQTFTTLITTTKSDRLLPQYFCQHLNSRLGAIQFRQLTGDSGRGNLNAGEFINYEIDVPSISEQRVIALVLECWDKAIGNHEALLTSKADRKRGLMQQLLTGKKRFKEFEGERWRTLRVGELLEEVNRYVEFQDKASYRLASIRRRSEGLFFREALRGSEIKTKVLKTIQTGDFLLSKMQVVHGAWGLVTPQFNGMFVSDSYIALVPRDPGRLNIEFFNYLSQTRFLRHLAFLACHGVHIEKMTFNLEDFLHEKITIPPSAEEQGRIASVLETCDREIGLLQKQLEALKEQKRGLMQKLLTGEIRVPLTDPAESPKTQRNKGKDKGKNNGPQTRHR